MSVGTRWQRGGNLSVVWWILVGVGRVRKEREAQSWRKRYQMSGVGGFLPRA